MTGPKKLSAADYLAARGWVFTGIPARDTVRCYVDPLYQEHDAVGEDHAVTLQRARDAAEERVVWGRVAAAVLPDAIDVEAHAANRAGEDETSAATAEAHLEQAVEAAALLADSLLLRYRARFAVEVSDAPQASP